MKSRSRASIRSGRERRRGNAVLELTFSLAFLIPLFLGTWQFGYGFYLYAQLEQAVRAGARYAALQPYHSATTTPTSDYLTAVRNVVAYGTDSPGSQPVPVAGGLTPNQVGVTVTFNNNVPVAVSVYITGYKLPGYYGNLTLSNKPLAWFPYSGMFGPP